MPDTPSPLFRPEDQPPAADLEEAERIARESGEGFLIPAVHQWPSSIWINPAIGVEPVINFRCPKCHVSFNVPESRLIVPPGKPVPNCGKCSVPPDYVPLEVTRYGSGPYELKL